MTIQARDIVTFTEDPKQREYEVAGINTNTNRRLATLTQPHLGVLWVAQVPFEKLMVIRRAEPIQS